MDDGALERLLAGQLEELPGLPRRVVRLFISSTFTDMTLERNTLMERVYPRLKRHCRERHGLDFQVVDMRWGVRDEATDDHQTAALCSREIDNCQRVSLGPSFVALLGDKYGFRPLCSRIGSQEFRALRRCLIELDVNTDFLDTWYREDLNALPAEYLLQPISLLLKNFANRREPELQALDQRLWAAAEERLRWLLQLGSARLVEQGRLTSSERALRYCSSVTEREVLEGCLELPDAQEHCLVYVRSIGDIEERLESCLASLAACEQQQQQAGGALEAGPADRAAARRDSSQRRASLKIGDDTVGLARGPGQATSAPERRLERSRRLLGRYVDLRQRSGQWQLDVEARRALQELSRQRLPAKLRSGRNLAHFRVAWHEREGISGRSDEHQAYVRDLADHFFRQLARLVRRAARQEGRLRPSGLVAEVLQQAHLARHWAAAFHGREPELELVRAYVAGAGRLPMLLYGLAGCGKSALLARAASLLPGWLPEGAPSCLVLRFCCATPSSSTLAGVLASVCRQLQLNLNLSRRPTSASATQAAGWPSAEQPLPDDIVQLAFLFRQLLEQCAGHRRIFVLILDAVDKLTAPADCQGPARHSWLTQLAPLAPNVRLLVSVSSEPEPATGRASPDFQLLKRHFLLAHLAELRARRQARANQPRAKRLAALSRLLLPVVRMRSLSLGRASSLSAGSGARAHWSPLVRRSRSPVMAAVAAGSGDLGSTANQPVRGWEEEEEPRPWLLHVRPLGPGQALELARRWLAEAGRSLTEPQWALVERSFRSCSRPIFVRLAFGEFSTWKSYSVHSDTRGLTYGSALLEARRKWPLCPAGAWFEAALEAATSSEQAPAGSDGQQERGQQESTSAQLALLEHQWANYVELRQRRQERLSQAGSRGAGASKGRPEGTGGANPEPLVFRLAGQGRSAPGPSACQPSSSVDEAVSRLLGRIELQHGLLLTKHALGYVSAARAGLCEHELEDILSLDDVVLDDVFQYHLPPVRRIPPLLWTRIRNDLPGYLSERDADGIVIGWHHGHFRRAATSRYLSEAGQRAYIHSTMADYFLGVWADRPKPYRCSRGQAQLAAEQLEGGGSSRDSQQVSSRASSARARLASMDQRHSAEGSGRPSGGLQARADRRVPQQPLRYPAAQQANGNSNGNGREPTEPEPGEPTSGRFNLRKLVELPHHLMGAGRFTELAREVLFNFAWLAATLEALGLQRLLADLAEASGALAEALAGPRSSPAALDGLELAAKPASPEALASMRRQLQLLGDTLRLSSGALHQDGRMLAPQLLGRLLALVAAGPPGELGHLSQLLQQCDRLGPAECALLPLAHCLQAPDGLLASSLEGHSFAIGGLALAADGRHLVAVSDSFVVWDLATGQVSRQVSAGLSGALMRGLRLAPSGELALAIATDGQALSLHLPTQQVSRLDPQRDLEPDGADGAPAALEGLEWVEGGRFVVWSRRRWFLLACEQGRPPEPPSIRLLGAGGLADLRAPQRDPQGGRLLEVRLVRAGGPKASELTTLAVVASEPEVELVTCGQPETAAIKAACLALDAAGRRLVFADFRGRLYLSRLRAGGAWSPAKLLYEPEAAERPLAVELHELEPAELHPPASEWRPSGPEVAPGGQPQPSSDELEELARLERRLDGEPLHEGPDGGHRNTAHWAPVIQAAGLRAPPAAAGRIQFVKLYLARAIVVLRLSACQRHACRQQEGRPGAAGAASWPADRERRLELPGGARNVALRPNVAQIKAIIVHDEPSSSLGSSRSLGPDCGSGCAGHLVAVAWARSLLIYELASGSPRPIRWLEQAHGGRIVGLVGLGAGSGDRWGSRRALVASASMDRTVRLWNLGRARAADHQLARLGGPVEQVSLARQLPLAACLARGQVALFDWSRNRLLQSLGRDQLGPQRALGCRLSSCGRRLAVAGATWAHLFALGPHLGAPSAGASLELQLELEAPAWARLELLRFLNQESQLLLGLSWPAGSGDGGAAGGQQLDEDGSPEPRRLRLFCLALEAPAGRQLWRLELRAAQVGARARRPLLTRDQQLLVCLAKGAGSGDSAAAATRQARDVRRGSLAAGRAAASLTSRQLALDVYSTRDGARLRRIELASLGPTSAATGERAAWLEASPERLKAVAAQGWPGGLVALVAAADEPGAASQLLDAGSGQLVAGACGWTGQVSGDGRLALGLAQAAAGAACALQLLDGRHLRPARPLLAPGQHLVWPASTGDQLRCAFSRPNDAYVYCWRPGGAQLLLVRLRDGRLLAHYRLPAPASCLKRAPDGLALLVGLADGSLAALAIADPERPESEARLAQYASRRLAAQAP